MDAQVKQLLSKLKALLSQVWEIARLQRAVALRQDSHDGEEEHRQTAKLIIERLWLRGVQSQLLKFKKSLQEEFVMKLLDHSMTRADVHRWLTKRLGGKIVDDNAVYRFADHVRDAYVAINPQRELLDGAAPQASEPNEDTDPQVLQAILRLRADGSTNKMLDLPDSLLVAACSRLNDKALNSTEVRKWLERRLDRRISGSLFYHFANAYIERLNWVREGAANEGLEHAQDAGGEPKSPSAE